MIKGKKAPAKTKKTVKPKATPKTSKSHKRKPKIETEGDWTAVTMDLQWSLVTGPNVEGRAALWDTLKAGNWQREFHNFSEAFRVGQTAQAYLNFWNCANDDRFGEPDRRKVYNIGRGIIDLPPVE